MHLVRGKIAGARAGTFLLHLLAVLVLLGSRPAVAQDQPPEPPAMTEMPVPEEPPAATEMPVPEQPPWTARHARGVKVAGIVFTSMGVLSAVFVPLAILIASFNYSEFGGSGATTLYLGGAIGGVLGTGIGLGVGIPLWVVGNRRLRAQARVGFAPTFGVAGGGGGGAIGGTIRLAVSF
jgi:hypothetical protein